MSGDLATEYWVAMAQGMAATYPSSPHRVLEIFVKAGAELGSHRCAAAAQLTGLAARAHASLGDRASAQAQLGAAERIADRLTSGQADEPFFGFPRREALMYTSQVLTAIGDPAAWNAQSAALSCYPDTDPIDRPLILLGRARHLASHGDADQAAGVAAAAITELAPAWRVPLLFSEARAVGKAIAASSSRAGQAYLELLRDAAPA